MRAVGKFAGLVTFRFDRFLEIGVSRLNLEVRDWDSTLPAWDWSLPVFISLCGNILCP